MTNKKTEKDMRKNMMTVLLAMFAAAICAKDIKTVVFTTTPPMHCESCENKIKGNLRFEKGVKSIETNVGEQRVTVTYNAEKTTVEKLQKGFERFGYNARVVKDEGSGAEGRQTESKNK